MPAGQFNQSLAGRRYIYRFLPTMTLYVVLLLAAQHLIRAWHPEGAVLALLAVLPALPLAAVVVIMGLYIAEESDEYLRHQMVRAVMIATGFMLVVTTIWGFLEEGGVLRHLPLYWAFIIWCMGLGFAQAWNSWRDILRRGQ
ncbi:hypothetical protein EAH79_11020 [Sphingomonas koreensis]|nr:hypothetical protein EAH79_11020 [Sphingomonas koreensis]